MAFARLPQGQKTKFVIVHIYHIPSWITQTGLIVTPFPQLHQYYSNNLYLWAWPDSLLASGELLPSSCLVPSVKWPSHNLLGGNVDITLWVGEQVAYKWVGFHCQCPLFFFFLLFRAAPRAYGGSQARRGPIGAAAASPCHSLSNARSEPHLRPTP